MSPLTTALLGCTLYASDDGTVPHSPVLPGWIVLRTHQRVTIDNSASIHKRVIAGITNPAVQRVQASTC
jgi:hypothetical protein